MLCYTSLVANKLRRYGAGYLHFITTSCYRRLPLLEKPQHRDLLLEVLERVRRRYHFVVVGYASCLSTCTSCSGSRSAATHRR